MDTDKVYSQVQEHYSSIARAKEPKYGSAVERSIGYTEEELKCMPQYANLGGETVIDLGSGAGFDVFLAAKKVGAHGRAIGVDMNKDMLERARNNQSRMTDTENVSFFESKITAISLADGIADCIISNCVINLVPESEKSAAFAEMSRLLKPGGRVALSDILAKKPLSAALQNNVTLYVNCIAGCSSKENYTRYLEENGFQDVVIVDAESDLNVYAKMAQDGEGENGASTCCSGLVKESKCSAIAGATECCTSPSPGSTTAERENCSQMDTENKESAFEISEFSNIDINEFAGSFKIFAVKK